MENQKVLEDTFGNILRIGGDVVEKIKFAIEGIKEVEQSDDQNFATLKLDLFASGQNSHQMPVSDTTLRRRASTSYSMPIVWEYDVWNDNIGTHSENEVPCGFIPESNNPPQFTVLPDGRTLLSFYGKLWKRYSGKLMEILKKRGGKTPVSVEMDVLDFDQDTKEIKDFVFRCVTLLGDFEPAIPDAQALVLSFSKDKDFYYQNFESKNSMKINNSKEASVNSQTWNNPGRKLYNALLSKSNKLALVKEAYLVVNESKLDSAPSEALSYPHHSVKNDELVLNIKGLYAARQRAAQQGIDSGEVLAHLKKHYSEIGEVFAMGNNLKEFEAKEESKLEEKVMMEEPVEEKKFEEEIPVTEPKPEGEPEEKEEEEEDFACKFAEASKQLEEYAAKFAALEEEAVALRKYKADKEESEKNYAIEQTMAEVNEYLPKDEVEKFRAEAAEVKFSEVEAFKNKIKARSLDFAKTSQIATNRMAIVRDTEEKKDKWGW